MNIYEKNDLYVDSSVEQGARIYVRERYLSKLSESCIDKAVLFIHGATYPGISFDMEIEGYAWMSYVADHGYAAYYLDFRGYGNSTRPVIMESISKESPPFCRALDAIHDIEDVINFIRSRTNIKQVSLIAWSWGTICAGLYTSLNKNTVDKLVLYAPNHVSVKPLIDPGLAAVVNVEAFRFTSAEDVKNKWFKQFDSKDITNWCDIRIFEHWYALTIESESGNLIRSPNGCKRDILQLRSGIPIYDASAIDVPVLIIRGTNDTNSNRAVALALYEDFGSYDKRYIEISHASHFIFLEYKAPVLMKLVQQFVSD